MDLLAGLENKFADALGINTASLGRTAVERIISQAAKRVDVADAEAYLNLLSTSPEEEERCLEELVVPETWFFRDREPFNLLQRHLCARWFPHHPGETVRILSLPCSTGEEPYSIAITLLAAGIDPAQFHLDAADISRRALAAAERAEYGKGSFREPLTSLQESFFAGASGGGRRVVDAVVGKVRFRRENIVDQGLLAGCEPYHVIFCRNVLIYMTEEARKKVLANIDRLLAPEGLLFTGHAEMGIFLQQGYTVENHPRAFACRRGTRSPLPGKGFEAAPPSPGRTKRPAQAGRPVEKKAARPVELPSPAPPESPPVPVAGMPAEAAVGALHAEALALADRGRFDEAEALCRRYLAEQNPHADVYCLLGLIQEAARQLEGAEECYLRSLYLDPDHYETLIHLSLLYRQRGDNRRASLLRRRAEASQRSQNGTGP